MQASSTMSLLRGWSPTPSTTTRYHPALGSLTMLQVSTPGSQIHKADNPLLLLRVGRLQVGDGQNFSYPSTFTTLQAVGPSFETYRIGVVADVGLTDNSTVTFQHLTESLPDLVSHFPDKDAKSGQDGALYAVQHLPCQVRPKVVVLSLSVIEGHGRAGPAGWRLYLLRQAFP